MKTNMNRRSREGGFVLIASLLILLVLTVLGIAVNRNTGTEWQIAMNDRIQKKTFYNADAATELATEVLEQSIACLGFGQDNNGKRLAGYTNNDLFIEPAALGFWRNYSINGTAIPTDGIDETGDGIGDGKDCDTDGDGVSNAKSIQYPNYPCNKSGEQKVPARQMVYPAVFTDNTKTVLDQKATNSQPHVDINIGGNTKLTAGTAIQMAAGYEGAGKGLGIGGATLLYDINVQQMGKDGSKSVICIQYGHRLGSEGDCYYH